MALKDLKVTLHMVSSLDGLIAKKDNSIAWFETKDHYEHGVALPESDALQNMVDCYVMGANTYEHALALSKEHGWPYGDVPMVVVTHREFPAKHEQIEFYSGDLVQLMDERLKPRYEKVWVVGGASLITEFIRLDLADEIRQPILPILLGEGVPFYGQLPQETVLHLKEVTAFRSGMVELCYEIRR